MRNNGVRGVICVLAVWVMPSGCGDQWTQPIHEGPDGDDGRSDSRETRSDTFPDDGTASPDTVDWSTLSGTVAFISGSRSSGPGIGVLHAATREMTVLPTVGGGYVWSGSVALSPDGSRIAYAGGNIYVMNIDGSDARLIVRADSGVLFGPCFSPTWSPDGAQIFFLQGSSGEGQVESVRPDGTYRTAFPIEAYGRFSISPAGDRVAIAKMGTGGISIVAWDGSTIAEVPPDGGLFEYGPTWSPDGTQIAFIATHDEGEAPYFYDVVLVGADGTGRAVVIHWPIVYNSGDDAYVVFSPDGARLMFDGIRAEGGFDLYTIALDGSNLSLVTTSAMGPSWSR